MKRTCTLMLAVVVTLSLHVTASAQTQKRSREQMFEEIVTQRKQLIKLEEEFLAPAESDRAAFAELLKQPNTGVIRLLPREKVDTPANSKVPQSMTLRGGGAYYSFTRLTHEYGWGSDIELAQDNLSVGFAGADYGFMLKLGDVPLEDLSTENPGLASMYQYRAATAEPDARAEYRRFQVGGVIDGLTFTSRLPVEVKTTYALRSIDYGDSDLLVVFRVVRRDSDGSIIMVWKQIKKYDKPELARTPPAATIY